SHPGPDRRDEGPHHLPRQEHLPGTTSHPGGPACRQERQREDHRSRRGQAGGHLGHSARQEVTGPHRTIAGGPRAMHAGPMSKNRTRQHTAALALSVVLAIGGAAAPSSAAPRPSETTLSLSHSTLRKGEMVWLKGKVKTSSGKAVKGAKVHVERRLAGGKWKRFATLRTSSKGSFSQRQLATKEYEYRAKVVAS